MAEPLWRTIANEDLVEADLPPPGGDLWRELRPFAMSFRWTEHYPNHHEMIAAAHSCREADGEGRLSDCSLTMLRASLWFGSEAARWATSGAPGPGADLVKHLHAVVEAIRAKVRSKPTPR